MQRMLTYREVKLPSIRKKYRYERRRKILGLISRIAIRLAAGLLAKITHPGMESGWRYLTASSGWRARP